MNSTTTGVAGLARPRRKPKRPSESLRPFQLQVFPPELADDLGVLLRRSSPINALYRHAPNPPWSFQQAGVTLPHSSQLLADGGQPVPLGQIQPGDVITYYSDASHVGLYVGNGKMVHASTYGVPVAVVSMHNAPIYNIRRYR